MFVDGDGGVAADGSGKHLLREVVEQVVLDGSLHWACTILRVEALTGKELEGAVSEGHGDAVVGQHLADSVDLQSDDAEALLLGERLEGNDLVASVD